MKLKELHEENIKRSRQLNDENKKYFKNISAYMKTKNVKQQETEEVLYEILDHMLLGQIHGKKAEEIFGGDIKAYGDDLLSSITKKNWIEVFKQYVFVYLLLLSTSIITSILEGKNYVQGFEFIEALFYLIPFILMKKIYQKQSINKNQQKTFIKIAVSVFILAIVPIILISTYIKRLIVPLANLLYVNPVILLAFGAFGIAICYYVYQAEVRKWKL
jgi:DNA-binding ferritin-like protein (Dps family)